MDRLSDSERRGFGSIFGAAVLAFCAWAFPNMSRYVTVPGAIACFLLACYFFWPDIRHLIDRTVAVVVCAFLAILFVASLATWCFWPELLLKQLLPTSTSNRPLAGLTNTQLRERITSFTKTIREFEAESDAERIKEENDFQKRSFGKSRDELAKEFSDYTEKDHLLRDAHLAEFKQKYRPEAVVIRDELINRFGGKLPTFPAMGSIGNITVFEGSLIFDSPILSGPYPIAAGADLLDFWASRLP